MGGEPSRTTAPSGYTLALCHARRMKPQLLDSLDPALTIPRGQTGFGGIVWATRRIQAELRDLRAHQRQFRGENARQHDVLTHRIDQLIDSRIHRTV